MYREYQSRGKETLDYQAVVNPVCRDSSCSQTVPVPVVPETRVGLVANVGQSELMRDNGTKIEIGDRICSEESYGTVRFIGTVPPTKGLWLGVDWDDPTRGKHDGSYKGTAYFSTKYPTSGSFIRPQKAELGVEFIPALKERYGLVDDENAGVVTSELYVLDSKKQVTVVEMVGAKSVNKQQSQFDQLLDVSLREMMVCSPGGGGDLAQTIPNLEELNVSRNLLTSWHQVSKMAEQLFRLKILNVSENRLDIPEKCDDLAPCFKSLTVLFLNRMGYTWEQIVQCCTMTPVLEKLHVCFNCIHSLSEPTSHLQHIRLLNLESNQLTSWQHIIKLGSLPLLDTLIISDNQIEAISFPETPPTGKTKHFNNLRSLSINRCKISEWSSINELNKLRTLEELRLKNNPLLETANPGTVRQMIVAKLGSLKVCNRTEIESDERKGSEIDYLKTFGPLWLKCGGREDAAKSHPSPEFVQQHPRYQQLVELWGAAEESEMEQKPQTLKSSLISVKIYSPFAPEKGTLEKKLPVTMTVQKLRTMIQRIYRVDSAELKLFYLSHRMEGPEIELDNDLRQMSFYSVESGDTILAKW